MPSASWVSGRETFEGANGRDLIKAVDGARRVRDRIECGRGRDRVIADRTDEVDRDCERVKRRR